MSFPFSLYLRPTIADYNISNQYITEKKNKFDTPQEIPEKHIPNDEYENFVTTHTDAVAECIPTKPKATSRIPLESIAVRKKRNNTKKK